MNAWNTWTSPAVVRDRCVPIGAVANPDPALRGCTFDRVPSRDALCPEGRWWLEPHCELQNVDVTPLPPRDPRGPSLFADRAPGANPAPT